MKKVVNLDVLVVYSASLAISSSASDSVSQFPFLLTSPQGVYNRSYAYFLETCQKRNLKAGFTTSSDIIGPGLCQSYWTHSDGRWNKELQPAVAHQVFDKISPTSERRSLERELLFSDKKVVPFNDPELFFTFFDKLQTFTKLPEYAVPTVSVPSDKKADILLALRELDQLLSQHKYRSDFSQDIIMKDRFGAGGNFVYKIQRATLVEEVQNTLRQFPEIAFVFQPFLTFDSGFSYQGRQTATDIRLIFQHDALLQCYFRMAKSGDFRCNEHQGGELCYVTSEDIPSQVLSIAKKIVAKIDKKNMLFALDFVVSNAGNIYFLEGNIGPGIDWNDNKKVNRDMSKQLIRNIVEELVVRSQKDTMSVT